MAAAIDRGDFNLDAGLGTKALVRALALAFKVSQTTVWRDLAALRAQPVCPVCGKPRD